MYISAPVSFFVYQPIEIFKIKNYHYDKKTYAFCLITILYQKNMSGNEPNNSSVIVRIGPNLCRVINKRSAKNCEGTDY